MGSGGLAGKMTIDFSMTTLPKRVALLGLALGLSAALAAAAGLGFVASVAADPKPWLATPRYPDAEEKPKCQTASTA